MALLNLLVLVVSLLNGNPVSAALALDLIVLAIGFGGLYLLKFLKRR